MTVFYRWSIYLERNEALKSFETIKLAEEHKREQLAKHGLENSHDRAQSFHQLQSSPTAAKIKGMVEFTVHDNPKSILSNVKRVVKYFGQIKNNTSVKNDTNMLVNLSDVEVNSSQDQDGLSSHSRCLTIKSLCTVDMIILKPNVNINAIKRSVYQYAMAKSEMQGTSGTLSDSDKPPLFLCQVSILMLDQNELNHHNIADLLGTAYDGILLTQIDMAGNKYGLNWVYETLNDIKIHANENKINKIILVQDAAATFTNPNYDIHDLVDGVVMVNPT